MALHLHYVAEPASEAQVKRAAEAMARVAVGEGYLTEKESRQKSVRQHFRKQARAALAAAGAP